MLHPLQRILMQMTRHEALFAILATGFQGTGTASQLPGALQLTVKPGWANRPDPYFPNNPLISSYGTAPSVSA